MPNVFIVLATYEGQRYLPQLIESIRRQSCRDWTLLARDDGSSDATPAILRRAATEDPSLIGGAGSAPTVDQAQDNADDTSSAPQAADAADTTDAASAATE